MHAAHSTGEGRCARGGHSQTGHHDIGGVLRFAMSQHGGGHGRHGNPGGDRGRHRHRGFGGGSEGFGGFGFGGGPRGRGRKARRGDIRTAALLLLAEEPRNGYQIMQEVQERSDGVWRPSPGSVYPALQQLEDEGLVRAVESNGRKLFELTDEGRAHVEEHREELKEPWAAIADNVGEGMFELRSSIAQVGAAVMQIAYAGNPAQVAEAREVLAETRRSLYRILAEDAPEPEPGDDGPAAA
jgi:DNA-binding PadR family transcriptional regulator